VSYRFVALALVAALLCACDLFKVSGASATPAAAIATFESTGTAAPGGSAAGTAGAEKTRDIFGGSPSPLASTIASLVPSPSLPPVVPSFSVTLPPVFTPTVPPTLIPTPTIAPPTLAPTPSPTVARATIASFVPEFGLRGAFVFINGTGLASTRLVLFGDVAVAPAGPPTDVQVTVIVPQAAMTSRISVVTVAGVTTSERFFTVMDPAGPTPAPTCPIRVQCPSPTP
jgi:hypothetical protein